MFINNLETKVEHFDMTDEVKVSTVMNETEVQNISASNINDNNVEGDCPPPKGEPCHDDYVSRRILKAKPEESLIKSGFFT